MHVADAHILKILPIEVRIPSKSCHALCISSKSCHPRCGETTLFPCHVVGLSTAEVELQLTYPSRSTVSMRSCLVCTPIFWYMPFTWDFTVSSVTTSSFAIRARE